MLDRILTNKWLGLPILLLVLFIIFEFTFAVGAYPQGWIDGGIASFSEYVKAQMPSEWYTSLLTDGLIVSVGAVLSFVPNILFLFFFLTFLEDSGYMFRVAFLMDRIMHRIGLHGRSFIPMLVGFGCNVPAIMLAKNIDNQRERWLTMLMIPFMSCSARLPVYLLFVSAFFAKFKALVMISLYVIGVLLSILFALVMKQTPFFKQDNVDYDNPLPPLKFPTWHSLARHTWDRLLEYLQKIITVIIWASIILWALTYFPTHDMQNMQSSYLGHFGQWAEGIVRPLGFDWKMLVALITGIPAKEAIIGSMAILYPGDIAASTFTPLTAFGFMLFVLLYFPCVATIATLRKEINWKWSCFTVVHSFCLAWLAALLVYQIGSLL